MSSDKNRLIELLEDTLHEWECDVQTETLSQIADHLIANGVIVPPCKVGDTVYVTYAGYVTTAKVLALYIDREGGMFDLQIKTKCENVVGFKMVIDKDNYAFSDVFLTEEESEKALEGSKSNDR